MVGFDRCKNIVSDSFKGYSVVCMWHVVLMKQRRFLMKHWTPHPYQKKGIELLIGQGSGGLLLDPGLGKTSISLAAFSILKEQGLVNRMLVIAPLRPCYAVWPREIDKWEEFSDLRWTVVHGPQKDKRIHDDADIFIINPEGMLWLLKDRTRLEAVGADVLCVDESTKFKNSTTHRFKALRKVVAEFPRRWILTGTMVPNGIMDMFGQIYMLDLGSSLGQYITHFKNKYFVQIPWDEYNWQEKEGAFDAVTALIAPLTLRMKAEDHLDMPELITTAIDIELPEKIRKMYDDIETEFIHQLEYGEIVAANAAAAGTKCRQIANGAVYTDHPAWMHLHNEKMTALVDLVEQLGPTPLIVAYEYEHDRQRIKEKFPDAICVTGLSAKQYQDVEDRFNRGEILMLIGHPASMGHGLNLQGACHHMVWFGITWNFEYYDQCIRRIYRQGQKADRVFIYHIIATETKDEDVAEVLLAKGKTQDMLYAAIVRNRKRMYGEAHEAV